MAIADPHQLYVLPSVARWRDTLISLKKRCYMMETIDTLVSKLERIHVLSDLLLELLIGNPRAQILAEVIMETSLLPED
jgi:hypothetical protein